MKYLPRTKKQVIITSAVIATLAAVLLVGVYFFSLKNAESVRNNAANVVTETKAEAKNVEKQVEPPADSQAIKQAEATTTTKQETTAPVDKETEPAPSAEEVRLESKCSGAEEFITTRYVEKKDPSGNPWYPNNEALLNDLRKKSPTNYNFYQECVAAGKMQSL